MTRPGRSHRGLDIEYMVQTRTTWGTRIRPSGRALEWTGGPDWEPLVDLSEPAMTALAATVRESGFFDLPGEIAPEAPIRNGTVVTWKITLDGRRRTVRAQQIAGSPNPVLQLLNDEVQRHVGEALNAIADAESDPESTPSA